jgi:hypothetical protein
MLGDEIVTVVPGNALPSDVTVPVSEAVVCPIIVVAMRSSTAVTQMKRVENFMIPPVVCWFAAAGRECKLVHVVVDGDKGE